VLEESFLQSINSKVRTKLTAGRLNGVFRLPRKPLAAKSEKPAVQSLQAGTDISKICVIFMLCKF